MGVDLGRESKSSTSPVSPRLSMSFSTRMTVSHGGVGVLDGVLLLRKKISQQAVSSPHRTTPKNIETTSTFARTSKFLRATPSGCASPGTLILNEMKIVMWSRLLTRMAESFGQALMTILGKRGTSGSSASLTLLMFCSTLKCYLQGLEAGMGNGRRRGGH